MSDIPEDIRKKAETLVEAICADRTMTLMGDVENMVDPIAQALLDERERCAEIIEHRPLAIPDRQELAAYIRSGWHSLFSTRSPKPAQGTRA